MKYYFEAVSKSYYDEEEVIICFTHEECKKKDLVVLEMNGNFIIASLQKTLEELDVLVANVRPKEIIQKVEVADYLTRKKNQTRRLLLVQEMEEKCKEVKMMETLKKYSDRDEDMKAMYESFKKLGK
ncbi:MAG: hypothetical protein RR598_08395 [Anaerorhabdus sp.]